MNYPFVQHINFFKIKPSGQKNENYHFITMNNMKRGHDYV